MFTPEPTDRPVEDVGELKWTTSWKEIARTPFMPPFRFTDQPDDRISLAELARLLGVAGPGIEESLQRHERVLTTRWRTAYLFYLVPVLLLTGLVLLALIYLDKQGNEQRQTVGLIGAALVLPSYFYAKIAFRAATLLSDRYYAETLAAVSILYILAELCRDEPITSPMVKRMLLIRMSYLARSLLLLSFRFPAGSTTQAWANAHFSQMLDYVRERERWVIAPVATTAEVLRQDLTLLAPILVLGTYGEFSWPQEHRKHHTAPRSRISAVLVMLTRGLGFLLPIILLTYLVQIGWVPTLGIPQSVIGFILLAWFLLAVNGMFRLGVVESFVNLTKAIKDLK